MYVCKYVNRTLKLCFINKSSVCCIFWSVVNKLRFNHSIRDNTDTSEHIQYSHTANRHAKLKKNLTLWGKKRKRSETCRKNKYRKE